MVLILEVPLAGIALVLSVLSWRTMRTIKHLDVGKSFWVPILMSGLFLFAGSIIAIVIDCGFTFDYALEAASMSRLLGLSILLAGIYTYSRRITKNLGEKYLLSAEPVSEEIHERIAVPESVVERVSENKPVEEIECLHDFGYLKSLPKGKPIPDECLSCRKIVECRHSHPEKSSDWQPQTEVSATLLSDANEEEESLTSSQPSKRTHKKSLRTPR